ncbi:GGDEF domain-containing protein [Patescibacteria group bacterium]|nr:GGDEF domain-containing protein [Patescibacteria group bacterium]
MEWPKTFRPSGSSGEREARANEAELARRNDQLDLENALRDEHIRLQDERHSAEIAAFGFDALTGAMTLRSFEESLAEELGHIRGEIPGKRSGESSHQKVAVLFIDLDNFKQANDNFGHAAGDDVLKAAAKVCMGSVRHETDKVGRKGGDEFVVMLPGADQEIATQVAGTILDGLRADPVLSRHDITASIGVSTSAVSANLQELMNSADQAMYRAKKAGRNQVSV